MSKGDDTKYKKEQKATFNGVVKLASLLQKALETGRSNYVEMSEITRYISYLIKTQADDSSMYLDYIRNIGRDGQTLRQLSSDLVKLFDDITRTTVNGYEKLLAPNGGIDSSLLDRLIQVDSEMTGNLNMVRSALMSAKNHGEITDEEIRELRGIADELALNLSERKKIVK